MNVGATWTAVRAAPCAGRAARSLVAALTLLLGGCSWLMPHLHFHWRDMNPLAAFGDRPVPSQSVAQVIAALPEVVVPPATSVASRKANSTNAHPIVVPASANAGPTNAPATVRPAAANADATNALATASPAPVQPASRSRDTLDEVVARYEEVLPALTDQDARLTVRKRIADLKLERQSLNLEQADYTQVIAEYESLLDAPASPQVRDALVLAIRYQMARARDLAGQADQAVSDLDGLLRTAGPGADRGQQRAFLQEARFRRAESAFSRGDYAAAADDYEVAAAPDSSYRLNASYMLGWARFRAGTTGPALAAFFTVVEQLHTGAAAGSLSGSERELLADTLRASVLCLERGPALETLAAAMHERQRPVWQAIVYVALGQFYLDHQRFQDASRTFARYEQDNPLLPDAPVFALRAIDAFTAGGFPNEAEALQPRFVEQYGRGAPFHAALGDHAVAPLRGRLRDFIDRLAAREHAAAQRWEDRQHYLQAAHWYRAWLTNFDMARGQESGLAAPKPAAPSAPPAQGEGASPEDAAVAATEDAAVAATGVGERLMLLGDVLVGSGQVDAAVPVYQELIARFPDHLRAREAGYAVVLALTQISKADPAQARRLLAAELEFADRFATDPRAPEVAVHAARALLDGGDNTAAATNAEHALERWPLSRAGAAVAREIAGEARFALGDLAAAEAHFRAARDLAATAPERTRWQARLVASIGGQAERARVAGDAGAAIGHLRRMASIDPDSAAAIAGRLNVAALLVQGNDLAGAAAELESIRAAHPRDPQVADVPLRLADLYERLQRPVAAADELALVAAHARDAEQARSARYHAAELYLAGNAQVQARRALQEYVQLYPRPVGIAAEAVAQLRQLAAAAHDEAALRKWTQLQMQLHDRAPADGNERTRFLAAEAAFGAAEQLRSGFELIVLRQPLGVTLKEKRAALDNSVAAYERAGAYRVQQFLTGATLKIAGMYLQLGHDLQTSARPAGLTAAGLAQYEAALAGRARDLLERGVQVHELNAARARDGVWDASVAASFAALAALVPEKYARPEVGDAFITRLD